MLLLCRASDIKGIMWMNTTWSSFTCKVATETVTKNESSMLWVDNRYSSVTVAD